MSTTNIQLKGLQKSQRLAIQRAERAAAAAPAPLDPDFPYSTNSFDPAYFGIPANPAPASGTDNTSGVS